MTTRITSEQGRRRAALQAEGWVDAHGDYLFRFALHRVHDTGIAEDLTQETFVAALQAAAGFQGRSTERTWLTGILRHKIADHFRTRSPDETGRAEHRLEAWMEGLFTARGAWNDKSGHRWRIRDDERAELAEALERCMRRLPPQLAEIFVLHEQRRVPGPRLAEAVGITTNNLWVKLYRARVALRDCLESNWFDRSET